MMLRVLFVDDEDRILQGLRRMLRPLRREWQMSFAAGGREALETMAREPFDVIVADMRMPGMDGAELLSEVSRRHPQTVRIVLSGHADQETVLRAVGPAHQYLVKPCEPEKLKSTISRARALRELLADDALARLTSRLKALPSLPALYTEVMTEANSPDASVAKLGEIISQDVGMSAKVLQLVNSAFFGLRWRASDPVDAVRILGIERIKALALTVHVFSAFDESSVKGFSIDALWSHSLAVSGYAKAIAGAQDADKQLIGDCMWSGLLHDAGKLALAGNMPERYSEALTLAPAKKLPIWEAERQVFGASHAEVGAYLLGLWGLPDPVVEALAYHHRPSKCCSAEFGPLVAVHVADVLEHEDRSTKERRIAPRIDDEYLDRLGCAEQLPVWRDVCRELAEKATP